MLNITSKYQCSGCGACADVCPAHCIRYRQDASGFQYPVIDSEACIGCGACDRVCPIKPENITVREPEKCFAAWAKDSDVHRTSSSGGMGYLLAREIIARGGVVYGCSGENPEHIRHIRVDNIEGLPLLQGSKYVQSDTRGICKRIKEDVKSGRDVLFIGTPCQVSAVNRLYPRKPANLYTADLICHGVPSQKMLNDQITLAGRRFGNQKPSGISFRNGSDFFMQLTYPDRRSFRQPVWKVPYYKAFMDGLSYRPSCYRCPYASSARAGDITIGDFWGIKDARELPAETGVSVVFTLTDKGDSLLKSLAPSLEIIPRLVREAVDGNDQLRGPVKYSFRARVFRALYPASSLRVAFTVSDTLRKAVKLLQIIRRKFRV